MGAIRHAHGTQSETKNKMKQFFFYLNKVLFSPIIANSYQRNLFLPLLIIV